MNREKVRVKSEEVMKIFARGEKPPNLFTIHFYFLHRVAIWDAVFILLKSNMICTKKHDGCKKHNMIGKILYSIDILGRRYFDAYLEIINGDKRTEWSSEVGVGKNEKK